MPSLPMAGQDAFSDYENCDWALPGSRGIFPEISAKAVTTEILRLNGTGEQPAKSQNAGLMGDLYHSDCRWLCYECLFRTVRA